MAGAIHFDEFDALTGVTTPGLFLTGDLAATLTLEGPADQPINIGGDLDAAIEIGGPLVSQLVITGSASALIDINGSLGLDTPSIVYGSLTIGTKGASTPITADIDFDSSLLEGFVQINQPYAGTFSVDGNLNLESGGAGDTGVEFYGGLSGTLLVWSSNDEIDAHVDGAIIVGNATADAGAFASTGLIQIYDDLEEGSSILIKEQCQGRILVGGNVGGTITTEAQFESGSAIEIAYSLESTPAGVIHCKAASNPLAGQIIINSSGTSGTWSGTVKYGSGSGTTLSHTSGVYTALSSTWGGGAVGLVAFKLYTTECDPLPTNYIGGGSDSDVKVAQYGRVTWNSGFPFIVEWDNGGTWVNESGDWTVASGQGTRQVTNEYDGGNPVPSGRDYRVRPVTSGSNKLVCDDAFSSQTATDNFTYTFNTHTSFGP